MDENPGYLTSWVRRGVLQYLLKVSKEIELQLSPKVTVSIIHPLLVFFFSSSLHRHFSKHVFLGHMLSNIFVLDYLFQGLLLGETHVILVCFVHFDC